MEASWAVAELLSRDGGRRGEFYFATAGEVYSGGKCGANQFALDAET